MKLDQLYILEEGLVSDEKTINDMISSAWEEALEWRDLERFLVVGQHAARIAGQSRFKKYLQPMLRKSILKKSKEAYPNDFGLPESKYKEAISSLLGFIGE